MIECPNCGELNTSGTLFCTVCRTKLSTPKAEPAKKQKICPVCSEPNPLFSAASNIARLAGIRKDCPIIQC